MSGRFKLMNSRNYKICWAVYFLLFLPYTNVIPYKSKFPFYFFDKSKLSEELNFCYGVDASDNTHTQNKRNKNIINILSRII